MRVISYSRYVIVTLFALLLVANAVNAQDILCPEPSSIATTAPADLAQVQGDIDRLTLCVKRAQLLSTLDKAIEEREKAKDNVNNQQGGMLDTLKPISPSAKDVSSVMDKQKIEVRNMPKDSPLEAMGTSNNETSSDKIQDWKIRRIWGAKGKTKAQLVQDNGVVATVVKDDILPDGYVVVALSTVGVTIRKDGKSKDLSWDVADKEKE